MFVELAKLYFELTGDFMEKLLYWQKKNCNSSSNNSKGASYNWPKREQLPKVHRLQKVTAILFAPVSYSIGKRKLYQK